MDNFSFIANNEFHIQSNQLLISVQVIILRFWPEYIGRNEIHKVLKFTPSTERAFWVILTPFSQFLPVLGWFQSWRPHFGHFWPNFDHFLPVFGVILSLANPILPIIGSILTIFFLFWGAFGPGMPYFGWFWAWEAPFWQFFWWFRNWALSACFCLQLWSQARNFYNSIWNMFYS